MLKCIQFSKTKLRSLPVASRNSVECVNLEIRTYVRTKGMLHYLFSAGLDVLLGMGKTHLDYDDLLNHESIAQSIQVGLWCLWSIQSWVAYIRTNPFV